MHFSRDRRNWIRYKYKINLTEPPIVLVKYECARMVQIENHQVWAPPR